MFTPNTFYTRELTPYIIVPVISKSFIPLPFIVLFYLVHSVAELIIAKDINMLRVCAGKVMLSVEKIQILSI